MISLFRAAAAAPQPPMLRVYKTREERVAIGRGVLEQLPATPAGLPRLIRAAALQHEVSPATIRRAVDEALADADGTEPDGRRPFEPCRDAYVRVAMHAGNVRAAHRELQREGHPGLPSYETLARALRGDLGILAAMRPGGMKAFERFLEVGVYESSRRLELGIHDEKHLPLRCQDRFGNVVEDLWLVSIMDDFSRLILAWAVVQGAATAEVAEYVLYGAVMGHTVPAEKLAELGIRWVDAAGNPRDGFVGGAMDVLTPDHAKIFEGDRFAYALRFTAVTPAFARPYIAVDKAKLERFHRTLDLRLAALPGYTKGPAPRGGGDDAAGERNPRTGEPVRTARPYAVPRDADLPRVEASVETIDHVIEDYNREHVISTTGQTPLARWFSAETPVRTIAPVLLWPRMLPLPNRATAGTNLFKVQPRGVFVDGEYLTHPTGMPTGLARVAARRLPGQPGRVFVGEPGDRGRLICEVARNADVTAEGRDARRDKNGARLRAARSYLAEAGRRLKADAGLGDTAAAASGEAPDDPQAAAGSPAGMPKGPAPRRAPGVSPLQGDPAAAMDVPFDPSILGLEVA